MFSRLMIVTTLMLTSMATANAYTCEVDLLTAGGGLIQTFRVSSPNNRTTCREARMACRIELRSRQRAGRNLQADCHSVSTGRTYAPPRQNPPRHIPPRHTPPHDDYYADDGYYNNGQGSLISCIDRILSDSDLEIYNSMSARNICKNHTPNTINCAIDLDNRGLENTFSLAISACSTARDKRCLKTILADNDLEVSSSQSAANICNSYGYQTVLCAQDFDNRGIENTFSIALRLCE